MKIGLLLLGAVYGEYIVHRTGGERISGKNEEILEKIRGVGEVDCEELINSKNNGSTVFKEGVSIEAFKAILEGPEELLGAGAVVFVKEKGREAMETLRDVVKVRLAVSSDEELAERLKTEVPGMYYRTEEGVSYRFSLSAAASAGGAGLRAEVIEKQYVAEIPLFGTISRENFESYRVTGLPIVYVADKEKREWIREAGAAFKEQAKLALLEYGEHASFVGSLGIKESELPAAIIFDETGRKYIHKALKKEEQDEALPLFIGQFLDGTALPFFLSAEEPEREKNEGGDVLVVVGKTLERYTMDSSKDVLMLFHAPWCGFCKKMSSDYKRLGETVRRMGLADKVCIAMMDMTENDAAGYEIGSYPTIKLFKQGSNDVVDYNDGDRSYKGLAKFLKESGGWGVDLGEEKEREEGKEDL